MDFLAVLDYEHLDNGVFLTSFARSLAQKEKRGIIIHGDSEHTERIMQLGVMREEARKRAIKELNHRLVALFADEGVSTIALNGYQKSLLTVSGEEVTVDSEHIKSLPVEPMILLSNLGLDKETGKYRPVDLSKMATVLSDAFDIPHVTLFSIDETADFIKQDFPEIIDLEKADSSFVKKHVPENFRDLSVPIHLRSALTF